MVKIRRIIPPNDLISGCIVKYDNLPITHTHIYMTTDLYCYHHLFSYYIYICDIAIYDDNVVSFFWNLHHTWHVSVSLQYTKRYGQALGVASDLGPNPGPTKRSIWTSSKSEVKRTMPSSPEFRGCHGEFWGLQWGLNRDSMESNGI
jgi:hypothetical protein